MSSSLSNTERPEGESEYRKRIAAALMARIRESVIPDAPFGHLGSSRIFSATEYDLADAVLAVRDEEIEKAREEAAYAVEALNGAENRRQMWRERAEKAEALLRDAKAALIDLGCCDDPDCSEQACNHVLPRISAFFAALEGREPR